MKGTMRRLRGLLVVGLFFALAFSGAAVAQEMDDLPAGQKVTITGYVRDTACRVARGLSGRAHAQCSLACANKGVPLGIETAAGAYYLAFQPGHPTASANPLLAPYVEKKVRVTGIADQAFGIHVITITKVEPAS